MDSILLFFGMMFSVIIRKRKAMAKYSKKASDKVERAMREMKEGTLRSGSGKKVKSRKQAIAIGLSEARKEGARVPEKEETPSKKSSPRKATGTAKKSGDKKRAATTKTSAARKTAGKRST